MLFENDVVAIRMGQEFRGSQARVVLTVQNKNSANITNLMPSLDVGTDTAALRHKCDAAFPSVAATGLVDITIMIECMQPYVDAPTFKLGFEINGSKYDYSLPLPVHMVKFVVPVEMGPQDFTSRWNMMVQPTLEQQAVFNAGAPINPVQMPTMLSGLTKLRVVQNIISPNPNVIEAVGTLQTGSQAAGGGNINVGCLLRLELNPAQQALRLTVRTQVPTVSSKLLQVVQSMLS